MKNIFIGYFFATILGFYAFPSYAAEPGKKWQSFEQASAKIGSTQKPIILLIEQSQCPKCAPVKQTIESMANDRPVTLVRINAQAEPELAGRFSFAGNSFPRVLMIDQQGVVKARFSAQKQSAQNMSNQLTAAFNALPTPTKQPRITVASNNNTQGYWNTITTGSIKK